MSPVTKEKVVSLTKYLDSLKSKLTDKTPDKHKNREETYKQFISREIEMTEAKLNHLKFGAA
jgi:hypothetical protein